MSFLGSLSIQCKIRCNRPSDTGWSTGWCDQPVGHPWSISVFKLHFLLVEFWTLYLKFYAVNLCWKTVSVCSFCNLHSFTIFYTVIYSQCCKIYFLYFINWLDAGALLQLADAGGIGHMTRSVSLDYRIFFAI